MTKSNHADRGKAWRKICKAGLPILTSTLALAIWLLGFYALNFV